MKSFPFLYRSKSTRLILMVQYIVCNNYFKRGLILGAYLYSVLYIYALGQIIPCLLVSIDLVNKKVKSKR